MSNGNLNVGLKIRLLYFFEVVQQLIRAGSVESVRNCVVLLSHVSQIDQFGLKITFVYPNLY